MSRTTEDGSIKNVFSKSKYEEFVELDDTLAVFILYLIHKFYWMNIKEDNTKGLTTGLSVSACIE